VGCKSYCSVPEYSDLSSLEPDVNNHNIHTYTKHHVQRHKKFLDRKTNQIVKFSTLYEEKQNSQLKFHGSNVKQSGRLPSSRTSPCGSFMLGTPTRVKVRQMTAML